MGENQGVGTGSNNALSSIFPYLIVQPPSHLLKYDEEHLVELGRPNGTKGQ